MGGTLMSKVKYNRIILKLSGEALAGDRGFGINPPVIKDVAKEIKDIFEMGVQIGIVVGGGNMWRGEAGAEMGMERAQADYIGMLGTTMNGLALQDNLESLDVPTRVQTSIEMRQIAEPYIRRKAVRHLEKGRVVIFAGGTGNPYFSTDTTAALRAAEIGADAILMAKNGVDGIYTADPRTHKDAKKYETLTYMDILEKGLKVMDSTASSLSMDNHIPLVVFNLNKPGNIRKVVSGDSIGTTVKEK
ncbi:UMP kinase [Lentilactobacillus buchneri ATCC 11577]|jgi:uridylate kinase|uniref:Uridylate kinase n=2 Tax=Lentilactobacillus hilgardii TaxID=1588 RepID=C0XLI5_LENH9|nr:UMP kinase [Lentilactobacillus buchneri ATCC 11577]EEI23930.1 UMP kinase [Lentilactobacillus hilgardii DSM 20176 = ATCC 8290]EEI69962.1 UMP kinase [Lentilactobacillus hilgardii ATCC 27305]KRK59062.1 uridylate kinase [Lentilactobacillus hilgardii DSM 20176 = ATCC 8290]